MTRRSAFRSALAGLPVLVAAACLLAPAAPEARAAVGVGDQPKFAVKSVDGQVISLEKLRGKMVLLDFWATWCGPCMAQAPHMVELNQKYADKGLVIIGISLDRDVNQMIQGAKQAGFTWPQHVDNGGVLSDQFGVNGIPACYLIGPDGTVLWAGHPANIDGPLEQAFKEHPPQLVDPKVLQAAGELLGEAEQKATAGDAAGALKALGKVPEAAQKDEDFAARYVEVRKTLESAAETMLAEVEPLVEQKQYPQAVARLKDLATALNGMPAGAAAKKRLTELQARPEVRKAVEAAERKARADAALAEAQSLRRAKRHEVAYRRFKEVAKNFAGTPAAVTAASAVKSYEKDKAFVRKVNESAAAGKARAAFSMARTYRSAGKLDKARARYQSVIDEFPGTSFAETAQKEIDAMAKAGK